MNEQSQQAADGQGQSATALAEAPAPSSVFSVLDSPSAQPLVPTGTGALSGEFIPGHTDTGMARLVILDHPDVAPQAAQMVGEWGDLTKFASSLDVIKFGSKVETEIERFYAVMNEQAGKMEAHVFLEVANALMSGAETQDSGLAKIEKEAEEQFKRPFLVKLIAAFGFDKLAKKMDRERLPQISSFISSQFKSGGERINSWIDGIRVKTEDSCRGQIEGIRRWELAIAEGKKHEVLLAATMSAGYQVLDAANAALATLPEMSRKDQIDRIGVLTQRLVFLGRLYGDAPGRMVRSKHGLNGAVTTLVNVMSSANGFFIQLRQSAFDLTQGYQTRTLQRANADLGDVSASLSRRGAQVLGEVAVAAVGMAAENAKKQAELNKSLAATTLTMVENLKAAEQAAKTQIVEATKELAEGQRLMLELRKQQNMATWPTRHSIWKPTSREVGFLLRGVSHRGSQHFACRYLHRDRIAVWPFPPRKYKYPNTRYGNRMRPLPPEALYALSADPWTLGHSSVLDKAREKYNGRVLVGIANDPKKNYAFAQWERLRLAQKSLDVPAIDVRLVPGSLAKYMMREDIPNLVRGVRNVIDEAAETTLKFYYLRENPDLFVDVIEAEPDSPYAEISSSGVKECLKVGHDISSFVSSTVKQALESRIIRQYPVCVTGEMGAGKSTLSRKIADVAREVWIKCTYVDYDSIAHEIYFSLTDPIYEKTRRKVTEAFGESVVTADGFIDRAELARIVRENPGSVETLNSILRKPMLLRYGDMVAGKQGIILVDAALLVEFGLTHLGNHHAIVVTAPVETRVERVIPRYAKGGRTMSREDVLKMFSLQMSGEDKIAKLKSTVEENKNGSVLAYDNGETPIDARKALFDILAKIDVFGELRAQMVLRMFGISELESSALVAELKKKHEEPHRFYHTWEHIVELLGNLFERASATNMPQEEMATLGVAILFHDSVYDVSRTYYRDNEIHSAEYAKRALSSRGVGSHRIENVYQLIRDTAHASGEKPKEYLSMILHDLDMSILGSSPERYALYVSDIVAEFGIYPGREFVKGRLEMLEKWLADENLFVTQYGKEKFQERARENMRAEIERLKAMAA